MAKISFIKLARVGTNADEQEKFDVLDLSRVPCVGEFVRFVASEDAMYQVVKVVHVADVGGELAEVWAIEAPPG